MKSYDSDYGSELEKRTAPVAIIHQGAFVYANTRFLDLLGLSRREQLASLLFLDVVDIGDRELARQLLIGNLEPNAKGIQSAQQVLRIKTGSGRYIETVPDSVSVVFRGEECVQISFRFNDKRSLLARLTQSSWRLYLSVGYIAILVAISSGLLTQLKINNAPKLFFSSGHPAVVIDDAIRERFPNDEVFVLLFEGVALFSEGFLSAMDNLASAVLILENVDDVVALTRMDNIRGSAEGFTVEPLFEINKLDDSTWAEKREKATKDRFATPSIVAPDGSAMAMVVVPDLLNDSFQRLALYDAILAEVEAAGLQGYLSAVAGQMAVDVAELRAVLRDNMLFIPITVTIGLSLIWFMFRRILAVVLAGITVSLVSNSAIALFVIIDQPYTLTSSLTEPLLSALSIAALIHLFNAIQHASERGYSGKARVKRALSEVKRPALFTALTTAVGLASLAFSPIVPTAVFGAVSAYGVLLIYLTVMLVVPNLLMQWDRKPWPRPRFGLGSVDASVRSLSGYAMRRPGTVLVVVGLVLIAGSSQIGRVVVETNLQHFFPLDHPVRVATDRIDEKLAGTNSLDIVFEAEEKDGLLEPEVLRKIKAFQVWAEALPQVDKATSLVDFIEEMHWGFHEEDPAYRAIPDDRRLISQYLLVYDGDDLWDFVDRDLRLTHVPLNVNVHSANEVTALMDEIRDYFAEHFPPSGPIEAEIAGFGRLLADMEDLIVTGQVRSLIGALALILLLMVIEWRSLRDAVICMVPNLSPILVIFILMGIFEIWLDIATAMIASVAVGIAVDDTIHIYHGFISRYRRHGNAVWALARTYRHAGRAVTTTTVVLCAQFLVLMTSAFVPTANFGLLTSVGLLTAWFFDVVLLPAMLVAIFGRRKATPPRVAEAV